MAGKQKNFYFNSITMTKAKYFIYGDATIPVYFFTTTTRNTEDCINIIKERFNNLPRLKIIRRSEGVEKVVFASYKLREFRKVISVASGFIFENTYRCAKLLGISHCTILRHLKNDVKSPQLFRYATPEEILNNPYISY
jgi:hypothetical protein